MTVLPNLVCAVTGHWPPFTFHLVEADCYQLQNPTVANLLEDIAEAHNVDCDCNLTIGSSVWQACLATAEEVAHFLPSSDCAVALDTPLASLACPPEGSVHLVVSGETNARNDYLHMYRNRSFVSCQSGNGTVRWRAGSDVQLPGLDYSSYEHMCRVGGPYFVDKTDSLYSLLSLFDSPRLVVLRRPKGFGKTTFLSVFKSFFDPDSTNAYFPFVTPSYQLPALVSHARGNVLVFSLDFAKLNIYGDGHLNAACDRLMSEASLDFFIRYAELLRMPFGLQFDADFAPTFLDVVHRACSGGWKLCLTVDNYTVPHEHGVAHTFQWAIHYRIFSLISEAMLSRYILFGLMVGNEVYDEPWVDTSISNYVCDLTNSPLLSRAVGFTQDEIVALGNAASIDLWTHVASSTISTPPRPNVIYSAYDVLRLAHQLARGHLPSAPDAPVAIQHCDLRIETPIAADVLRAKQVEYDAILKELFAVDDVLHDPKQSSSHDCGDNEDIGSSPDSDLLDGPQLTNYDHDSETPLPQRSPTASSPTVATANSLSTPSRGLSRQSTQPDSSSLKSSPGRSDTSSRRGSSSLFSFTSDASTRFTDPPSSPIDEQTPK